MKAAAKLKTRKRLKQKKKMNLTIAKTKRQSVADMKKEWQP